MKIVIDEGKRAEYLLAHKALENNLMVCWPSSETVPFDLVVYTGEAFIKVQVKATYSKLSNQDAYQVKNSRTSDTKYERGDYDVLAVYIQHHNAWYLVPFEVVEGKKSLYFYPHRTEVGQLEHFRDAFHLLKGK